MRPVVDMPRAQRNALAEIIVTALHDRGAHAALAALARVLEARGGVAVELRVAASLRRHRIVIDAPDGAASSSEAARSYRDVALAPAFECVRDAATARVRAACVAADEYWRHACVRAADELAPALRRAVALFGAGLYFEVHEELESVWRRTHGAARVALQGLIQIAVALHHAERGNVAGARRLLAAGRAKVERYAPVWEGVAIDTLLADLRRWERARLDDGRVAAPPRLVLA
jgi:hypothetical protein